MDDKDKKMIDSCLGRLKRGCVQKIPSTMSLDAGIRNIFLSFDKDKTGSFTINEVNSICLAMGVPLERKYTMRILAFMDKDGNRRVDLDEFRQFLTGEKKVV